jgi:hypothetical protein
MNNPSYHPLNSYIGGLDDAFLSLWRLDSSTSIFQPQWLRYIGGNSDEHGREISVLDSGNVIITGSTASYDFISNTKWLYPVLNFYDTTMRGKKDAFIAKFSLSGLPLWGTYFGGSGEDLARGLVNYSINDNGVITSYIAIAGGTKSSDLLSKNYSFSPSFQKELNGDGDTTQRDAFIAIFTDPPSSGIKQQLDFVTYYGGKKSEWPDVLVHYGPGLALGGNGELYLTFTTVSTDIQKDIVGPDYHYNSNTGNDNDGFLSKILNRNIPNQFDCTSFDWGNGFETGVAGLPNNKIALYPNPSTGNITIEYASGTGNVQFIIYDMTGKIVLNKTAQVNNNYHFDLNNLNSGIYLLEARNGSNISQTKFVIQK